MTTFGEISYSDEIPSDKKSSSSKDLFLRTDEGDNEIRLLTNPFQYSVHKVKKDPNNPKDFGRKVPCSAVNGSCPACDHDKAKLRWLYGVVDRKTGQFRILDVSFSVFSQIRNYARNTKSWGDPTKYDINIFVNKKGGATGYYSVQPLPKEPLSAEDQKIKDNVDFDDLKRRSTPPSAEVVQKILNSVLGDSDASPAAASSKKNAVAAPKKVAPVSMDDDESADEFPDYNAK
jgi:hypothetical protein